MTTHKSRTRLAIIGGGPSALTTAYYLTKNEPDSYDITIYEMSWRLGGKTASGRDESGRIEEHGLHVLFGCYHNVFRMLLTCYEDLRTESVVLPEHHEFRYFFDSIAPHHQGVIGDDRQKPWQPIHLQFPSNRGVPGDPPLPRTYDLLITFFQVAWIILLGPRSLSHIQRWFSPVFDFKNRWKRTTTEQTPWEETHPLAHDGNDLGGDVASRAFLKVVKAMLDKRRLAGKVALIALVFGHWVWRGVKRVVEPVMGRFWSAVDFFFALFRGLIKDSVLSEPGGFEKIDAYDLREWLLHHKASTDTLGSPWMRIIYDAAFSYPNGGKRPYGPCPPWLDPGGLFEEVAAGSALRALLLMTVTYKGGFYNKMEAGMGDVVHTPLYLVLKKRNVKFEFFHRLTDLKPTRDSRGNLVVDEVEFDTVPNQQDYDPLVPVDGLLCWPSAPKLRGIPVAHHERARAAESYAAPRMSTRTLKRERDFDAVVLGIPVRCLPYACPSLLDAESKREDRPFPSFLDQTNVDTVQTIALQLWMKPTLEELGWTRPPPLLSLFIDPLNTWCDMSHLAKREAWSINAGPGTIAYFCGPFRHEQSFPAPHDLTTTPGRADDVRSDISEQAHRSALELLNDHLHVLMPTVQSGKGFNFSVLVDTENRKGLDRFSAQYLRVNYEPHALCTLARRGATEFRMKTDCTGYDNLFVTGDWIDNGVYLACVEGAVQSGIRTARAVSGKTGGNPGMYSIVAEGLLNLQVLPEKSRGSTSNRKARVAEPPSYGNVAG